MNYILASASPRRKELLTLAGLTFGVCKPHVAEDIPEGILPAEAARLLASQKARAVAAHFPEDCVIAADTLVVLGKEIFGKPKDPADAIRMLRLLSGKEHSVITGVCVRLGARERCFSQDTWVRFYSLTDEEIEAYVRSGEPLDKAGAYGIQGRGGLLVKGLLGDYFNVVGLPVARLVRELPLFLGDSRETGDSA